jgi:hypothetical protein
MKSRLVLPTILCLALAAVPAAAQTLYDNGPINGSVNAWVLNFGFITSDTFTLASNSTVGGFQFGAWEFPGDVMSSVDWSLTTAENAGTVLGSGTASGKNITDTFLYANQFGFNVDEITVTGLNVGLNGGTYWLNLQNAVVPDGDPIYWDENSGKGCGGSDGKGSNCPSMASENAIGTVYSESFTITGTRATPEAGSIVLFGSGVLGLAGMLRRKLF